ncbi:N-6 DNA methylase [Azotobacter beijerinckii]|uniref:N-6 DNA methylase n=1 Tax=Azotobacter beijerinckii TaxID=170623 RepID=UPI002954841A|nr:N-6 DNA methylase [Azotobacter beijerinckii]MDV7211337.1 N-6 DNA methylase [Azotobacter beijerinckii]
MQDKIITQLHECFTRLPLTPTESLELALQLLAWAKLSNMSEIPEGIRLSDHLLNEPGKLQNALQQLERGEGLVHQAFQGSNLVRLDPLKLRPALELTLRLINTGLLRSFEPTAAIASAAAQLRSEGAVPEEVANLMAGLTDIHAGESAYVPWDFWGSLASRMARADAEVYLETPLQSAMPALAGLLNEQPFQVHYADPILSPSAVENGKPCAFDVAIAFPPLGMRYTMDAVNKDWYDRFPEKTASGTILAIRHLLSQSRRRVVLAVANSVLFSAGAERVLREDLISQGKIEAVISMPAGLLSHTNIAFSILVLNPAGGTGKIKFINADIPQFCTPISKARCQLSNIDHLLAQIASGVETDNLVQVAVEDVLKNDAQLQVSRYVLPSSQKKLLARLNAEPTASLGELVSTVRPMLISPREEGETIEVMEVTVSDLPPYGFIQATGRMVKVPSHLDARAEQQFLRPFDIVLIVKGSVGKVGIIPNDVPPPGPGGWIAGQSAIVLRVPEKSAIDARALAMLLRSAIGQELLNGIVSGASSIKLIQLRELERLQILLPDQESSQHAIHALEKEADLQQEIDRLRQEQAKIAADLWFLA